MLKRVITAAVALCVFVPVMIFSDTWVYPIFFSVCAVCAVFEMSRCVGLHRNGWVCAPLYLAAAAAPVWLRLAYLKPDVFSYMNPAAACLLVLLLIVVWLYGVTVFSRGKLDITAVSAVFLGCLYAVAGFTAAVYLHDFAGYYGPYFYLMIFIGAWMTDSFAYFTGRLLGRHKLIPEISPKKTVEGAVGGIVFCAASFAAYALLYNALWIGEGAKPLNVIIFTVVGILTSVVSQIGDLAMSAVKRRYDVKDYSRLLPGHGGILDRFDSVLAVAILLTAACVVLNGSI